MATAAATQDTTNDLVPDGGDEGAEQSLRDTLEAAFEHDPTDEVGEGEQQREGDARQRDQHGRFAKPEKQSATVTEITPQATQTAQDAQTQANQGQSSPSTAPPPGDAKDLKAPASWTPQAREEWAALSPRIKAEVHRREYEANRVVQEGAQAKQFVSTFEQIMRPYEMFIRAENSNPMQAVQNMMSTAAQLRIGTPHSKANLVAGIINDFGIDIEALDTILAGKPGLQQRQQQDQQQFRDPRLDQFLAQQQQLQQQQALRDDMEMRSGLGDFAAKHEFYGDVSGLMADIVEVRARQGQPIDMEQIYKQACQLHDGVSTILTQRAATVRSTGSSNAVLRAKRAASSVRSEATPDGGHVPKDDSIRASLEAAIENVGRA